MTGTPSSPVKETTAPAEYWQALSHASALRGLSTASARLLHYYSNAVYLLPECAVVARITKSGDAAGQVYAATTKLVREFDVAATAPMEGCAPVGVGSLVVSFWRYYPQPGKPRRFTSSQLARILRRLHSISSEVVSLPAWDPLANLNAALCDPSNFARLSIEDRRWLPKYVAEVVNEVRDLDSPLGVGVIHGDAWAGNLLWDCQEGEIPRAILCDWDTLSIGPREIDLIPTWHAVARYGYVDSWSTEFAETYGVDLSTWPGYSVLMKMRDLAQLTGPLRRADDDPQFRRVLDQRLRGIREGEAGVWRAL